jgi:hypothetical protein
LTLHLRLKTMRTGLLPALLPTPGRFLSLARMPELQVAVRGEWKEERGGARAWNRAEKVRSVLRPYEVISETTIKQGFLFLRFVTKASG